MHRFLIALGFVSLANVVSAETLTDFQPKFVAHCTGQGNEEADCLCIFLNWSTTIAPEDEALAIMAIEMTYEGKPPDMAKMQKVMPLVMSMADVTMRCAAGALSVEGIAETVEIPQTGDAAEEGALLERLTSGTASLTEMKRYDEIVMARRADDKQAKKAAQAAQDDRKMQARALMGTAYEAELSRIHTRPLKNWAIAEYEQLFTLYCQMGGQTIASCSCAWGQVTKLAKSHALPYLASRSEGDDMLEHLSPGELHGTFPALSLLNERRAQCDGL